MARSLGVTISAGLLFLVSVLSLACGTLTSATMLFGEIPAEAPLPWMKYAFVGYVLVIFLVTVWEMTTAIGLFWLQPWARISVLVAGGLMVFFGLTSLPVVVAMPFMMQDEFSGRSFLPVAIGVGAFYFLIALMGGWWLYFFTRASVREQFQAPAGAAISDMGLQRPARPLSITVIAWFLLLTCWMLPAMSLLHLPIILLGFLLTGTAAVVVDWAYGLLLLYIGIGLLKRQRLAHTVAVCYFVFVILNGLVAVVSPAYEEAISIVSQSLPEELQAYSGNAPLMPKWVMAIIALAPSLVPLWFLVTRRKALLQQESRTLETLVPRGR